jgi:hypothetical protein
MMLLNQSIKFFFSNCRYRRKALQTARSDKEDTQNLPAAETVAAEAPATTTEE